MAAVALEDFVKPVLKSHLIYVSDSTLAIITVALAILLGLSSVGLAFLISFMGKTLLQICFSIFGMVGGPLLGLIVVGVFFPWINSWGAGIGLLCSLTICFWIGVGSILNPVSRPKLPYSVEHCVSNITTLQNLSTQSGQNLSDSLLHTKDIVINNLNKSVPYVSSVVNGSIQGTSDFVDVTMITSFNSTTTVIPSLEHERSGIEVIYSLSYLHYSTLAVIVSIIVGLIVSGITGFNHLDDVDPRTYFHFCGCSQKKPKYTKAPVSEKKEKIVEEIVPITSV